MCSYERAGWLGSWDLRFSNQDLGRQARKFCHINTSAQFLGWKRGRPCLDGIILLCMLYFPNHKHPILITAVIQSSIKVAKATIGVKVITLCFTMFALFLEFCTTTHPRDLQPHLISETRLKFLIWTQGEIIGPRSQASQVNWAHVKKP